MKASPTTLAGLLRIVPPVHRDDRGEFVKTFHRSAFKANDIEFSVAEEFFSTSRRGVIRGMHFQLPPAAHSKLVFCPAGAVLDVVVDLRRSSPTYGQSHAERLDDQNRHALYIPVGFAHGFVALSDEAVMYYLTDTEHAAACDAGIRWNSFGFSWPADAPILSRRDQSLPSLADFVSPF
jgi:dTDP-4-dehydrorhamnose 3,5-epimerase